MIRALDLTMNVQLDEGAYMPERAHREDAGADLRSPIRAVIWPHSSETIDTGVHVEIPAGYVGMLKSKSGLNIKHDITSEGVVDAGYTGSIRVKLYNNGPTKYIVEQGDKISQLVIMPIIAPGFIQVDEIDGGERGDNGFGSTGR
jgi:dUTP pyrophosphatase